MIAIPEHRDSIAALSEHEPDARLGTRRRKAGRPPLPSDERRASQVLIRFNEAEIALLEKYSSKENLPRSEYCRRVVLRRLARASASPEDRKAWHSLHQVKELILHLQDTAPILNLSSDTNWIEAAVVSANHVKRVRQIADGIDAVRRQLLGIGGA